MVDALFDQLDHLPARGAEGRDQGDPRRRGGARQKGQCARPRARQGGARPHRRDAAHRGAKPPRPRRPRPSPAARRRARARPSSSSNGRPSRKEQLCAGESQGRGSAEARALNCARARERCAIGASRHPRRAAAALGAARSGRARSADRALPAALPGRAGRDGDLRRLHREGHGRVHARQFRRLRPHRPVRALVLELALRLGDDGRAGRRPSRCRSPTSPSRFDFRGAALIQTLGFLPLIMPPFVGAVAMQLLFGRNGTRQPAARRLLRLQDPASWKGSTASSSSRPCTTFPFILLNLSAALRNIDRAMEEAAQNLGCVRLPAVPPHRLAARDAGLRRRRLARLRQGVRRPRDAAAAQRQGHAGAAGVSARHLDRHRRPDGLRDLRGARSSARSWRCGCSAARDARQATTPPCSAAAAGSRAAASSRVGSRRSPMRWCS